MSGGRPPSYYTARPVPGASRLPPPPPPLPSSPSGDAAYSYGCGSSVCSDGATSYPQAIASKGISAGHFDLKRLELWTCDACSLDLESEHALKSHRKSHVKCTECSFEGAPKVVKGHYQSVHGRFSGSGFKTVTVAIPGCRMQRFKICVGNRPEDIQRWIAERKKRFPRQQQPGNSKSGSSVAAPVGDSTFSSLLAGYGSSSDESGQEETSNDAVAEKPARNALEQKDEATEASTSENPLALQPSRRPCRYFMRNRKCLNGDSCRFSHDVANNNNHSNNNNNKRFPANANNRTRKHGKSTTSDRLLRKLLASDMERESVLTMQLLEYIVDANYFDSESMGG